MRSTLKLFAILALTYGVAFGKPRDQQPLHRPNFALIKIEIWLGGPELSEKRTDFIVGDLFSFMLVATNTSSETVNTKGLQVLLQERPELLKDGKALPFRENFSERLHSLEIGEIFETDVIRPSQRQRPRGLLAHESKPIGSLELNDWYEPLLPGRYTLIIRYRFQPEQKWIESAVTFNILPSDPGLSKTPFTSDYFSSVADELVRSVNAKKPAWRHERGTPFTGSENIIIDYWVTGHERVVAHMYETPSAEEATRRFQSYYGEANERLAGMGDEGLVRSGNIVSLRKGRLLIDVSFADNVPKAKFGHQLKISEEFARYIAEALPAAGLYSRVVLSHPFATASQVKIALTTNTSAGPGNVGAGPVLKFRAADSKISFGLTMKNVAPELVKVQVFFNHMQNRPELFKEGRLVPYLEEVQKLVAGDKEPPDYRRLVIVLLKPDEPGIPETINLADWYAALGPGHYRLDNKHRFDASQNWIDCGSVNFEIIP